MPLRRSIFCAGKSAAIWASIDCLLASAAATPACLPSARICNFSTSRCETVEALTTQQFAFGRKLVCGLLIDALRFLDLGVSGRQLRFRYLERGVSFDYAPPRGLGSGFLHGRVEFEQRLTGRRPFPEGQHRPLPRGRCPPAGPAQS